MSNHNPLLFTLYKAADLLEKEGWCQGKSYIGEKRCVLSALGWLATEEEYSEAQLALRNKIGGPIVAWNDQPGQTMENVVKTLRSVV